MMCRNRLLISCLLAAATAGFFAGQPGPFSAPGPKGVYVTFGLRVGQAQNAAYPAPTATYTPPPYPSPAAERARRVR
jgi:hypothetical protein